MELFKLFGSVFVNTDDAESSIQKTTDKAEGFATKLGNGIATAAKWGTAIVAGATAAGAAMVKFATDSAATVDNIDKMSQRLGISREAFQELDFVLSQSGVDINSFQTGTKTLLANMDKVTEGNKTAIDNFDKLGISVQNADGSLRSQEEVLFDTIAAFQGMEGSAEKSRLAQELFGKQGQEILPLLNSEAGSLEEMRQQAHDLGLVLDDELIDAGVELTDKLYQTKRAFRSIVTQLGVALMPIVTKVCDYIQTMMPTIQALVEQLAPVLTGLLEGLLPPLMDLAEQIFPILFDLIQQLIPPLVEIISAILPVITDLLAMLLPPIIQIVEMILPLLISLIEPLLPLLEPILALLQPFIDLLVVLLEPLVQLLNMILPPLIALFADAAKLLADTLTPIVTAVANLFGNVFNKAIQSIMPVVQAMMQRLEAAWQNIKTFITTYLTSIWTTISSVFNTIKTTISTVMNTVSGIFTTVWNAILNTVTNVVNAIKNVVEGVKTTFTNVFNALVDIVKAPLNAVISAVNFVIDALNALSFDVPDWVPGIGGKTFGFNLSNVAYLAEGGILTEPTYLGMTAAGQGVVAGEAGAEAIIPLNKMGDFFQRDDKAIIELLTAILKVLYSLDESLARRFEEVLENMRFEIDKREFGRLVRAV